MKLDFLGIKGSSMSALNLKQQYTSMASGRKANEHKWSVSLQVG